MYRCERGGLDNDAQLCDCGFCLHVCFHKDFLPMKRSADSNSVCMWCSKQTAVDRVTSEGQMFKFTQLRTSAASDFSSAAAKLLHLGLKLTFSCYICVHSNLVVVCHLSQKLTFSCVTLCWDSWVFCCCIEAQLNVFSCFSLFCYSFCCNIIFVFQLFISCFSCALWHLLYLC